jgi:hypothetical protein
MSKVRNCGLVPSKLIVKEAVDWERVAVMDARESR